jgi:hypothetical protein
VIGALVSAAILAAAAPIIHIEDVELFFKVYDGARGNPTAEQLQRDYLDAGSDGLRQFASMRKYHGVANRRSDCEAAADVRGCQAV